MYITGTITYVFCCRWTVETYRWRSEPGITCPIIWVGANAHGRTSRALAGANEFPTLTQTNEPGKNSKYVPSKYESLHTHTHKGILTMLNISFINMTYHRIENLPFSKVFPYLNIIIIDFICAP